MVVFCGWDKLINDRLMCSAHFMSVSLQIRNPSSSNGVAQIHELHTRYEISGPAGFACDAQEHGSVFKPYRTLLRDCL